MIHEHKPLQSWWPSKIEVDNQGKYDPAFDGDWSYRPTQRSKYRVIKDRLPDPKLTRVKMQVALLIAEKERAEWQAREDAMTQREKEIREMKRQLADLLNARRRASNP